MHRYQYKAVKKGFILIYTLIIGLICVSLALYCLKFNYNNNVNEIYAKNYLCKTSVVYNNSQYLLSNLNNEIVQNKSNITKNEITGYLTNNNINNIKYCGAYLNYDNTKNFIVIYSYVDEYSHREDYYDYMVTNSKIGFIYKYTLYENGGIMQ